MRFWLSFVLLFPLLLWQGIQTRRHTLRLPEAGGPCQGLEGSHHGDSPLSLHILGESPVAGVGVQDHREGIGAALALAVSHHLQRPVQWYVSGWNGATLATLLAQLPAPSPQHLTLVMMGVNDTTRLTPRWRWRRQLKTLHERLALQGAVGFFTLPPVHDFSALPQPLRYVLGLRAQQLKADLKRFCDSHQLPFLDYPSSATRDHLAADGYHPSALGYQALAAQVASQTAHCLLHLGNVRTPAPSGHHPGEHPP